MKTKLTILALALLTAVAIALPSKPPSGLVILSWNSYPTGDMVNPNLSFTIYHSTSLAVPMTNWLVLTNIPGTNLSVSVTIFPGAHFFAVTASNEWGEGNFSSVASTPNLPRSDETVSVRRGD